MTTTNLCLYRDDQMTIQCQEPDQGGWLLTFDGEIEAADPSAFLEPLLDSVHGRVMASRAPAMTVDITRLSFLNSSGIKCLLKWIMKILTLEIPARYTLTFRYSEQVTWQHVSLKAMAIVGRGVVLTEAV
jgi:hypothetical protein